MVNRKIKITQLTELTSASLSTTLVGVDNGITYRMELDTVADAITSRVNTSDRSRISALEEQSGSYLTSLPIGLVSESIDLTQLNSFTESIEGRVSNLESATGSYLTSLNGTISSSAQITTLGFVSSSTDITLLNAFTSSQSTLNTAFTNGINARLQTSSFNEYTASISTASLVTSISNLNSATSSYLTSVASGTISGSQQISDLGFVTGSYTTINSFNSLTQSFNSISQSFNVISGSVGTVDFNGIVSGSSQVSYTGLSNIPAGIISGSSQLDGTTITNLTVTNLTTDNVIVDGGLELTGSISGGYSRIHFVSESSGESGSIFSTIQMVPDINSPSNQQILIIDPTGGYPNHLHLRPGGPMDNSSVSIILGGENSNVSVIGGTNPPVEITSNNYLWQFNTDGTLIFPDSTNQTTAFTGLPLGSISGSSQLTSSFDERYAISASFVSSSNLSSIQTITSASYAALTPVSGTLYIIIG